LGFWGFCRLLRFDFLRYLKVIIGSVPEYVTSCFICSFPSSLLLHHANQLQGSLFEGQAGKALHRPKAYFYWDMPRTNEEKTKGLVPLLGQPHLRAKVDITMTHLASVRSCDRGCSVITGLPCCHQIALAEAGGHNIIDFMHEADTTVGWRKQYEGIDIVIPSAAEFENHSLLWDDTLALVPPYKRKRGRPNTKRKAGFLETRKKKASKTKEV
jgi:hypothetical protein